MYEHRTITRWSAGQEPVSTTDALALEEPLEIRVRGRAITVTMRTPDTPQHDAELAAGFLLTEGLVPDARDILRIDPCVRAVDGNVLNVFLAPGVEIDFERLRRHTFLSSSCGVCGKVCIESIHARFDPIDSEPRVAADVLLGLPDTLRAAQAAFDRTGGLHAAALFDLTGRLRVTREDIGRHNAVDKVLGHAMLERWLPLDDHVLLVSGRASFEIMQKALAARVPVVAAVSAPSSLAAEFAQDSRQTLVGFLRDGRMNLYTHVRRVVSHTLDDAKTSRIV